MATMSKTDTPVRDLMTSDCCCVKHDETLLDAAKKMQSEDVGALPVCGPDDKLQGMLTDRDIVVIGVAKGKDPKSTKAGDLVDGTIHWVRDDQKVSEVLQLMQDKAIRRVPVIDSSKQLCGIVAQADIAKHLEAEQTGQLVDTISSAKPNNG